jgi:hypothetical protein
MICNMNAIRMKTQNDSPANNDTVLIVNRSSSGGLTGILHEKSM